MQENDPPFADGNHEVDSDAVGIDIEPEDAYERLDDEAEEEADEDVDEDADDFEEDSWRMDEEPRYEKRLLEVCACRTLLPQTPHPLLSVGLQSRCVFAGGMAANSMEPAFHSCSPPGSLFPQPPWSMARVLSLQCSAPPMGDTCVSHRW